MVQEEVKVFKDAHHIEFILKALSGFSFDPVDFCSDSGVLHMEYKSIVRVETDLE